MDQPEPLRPGLRLDAAPVAGTVRRGGGNRLAAARFDVHFVDMWRYYLMYCEGGFAEQGIDVAQVTLVKPEV